eukprot:TRINITY_DN63296_c0_g2_i1.p1 TRINITY_DN63296_c0_g2~~TRINITY_DN63296_c0_g2_i1.p1  ORF type:complete len:318 (+),score=42.01 TRINITY_DN63296_c0_g2_i1:95-1048(+)
MAGDDEDERTAAVVIKRFGSDNVGESGADQGVATHLCWETASSERKTTSSSDSSNGWPPRSDRRRRLDSIGEATAEVKKGAKELRSTLLHLRTKQESDNGMHTQYHEDSSSECSSESQRSSGAGHARQTAASSSQDPRPGGGYVGNLAACSPQTMQDYPGYLAVAATMDLDALTEEQCNEMVASGILPSSGSSKHALGRCKPCAYLGSLGKQCCYGNECRSCHFPHVRTGKRRPRKARRDQCKKAVANLSPDEAARIQRLALDRRHASNGLAYMNALLKGTDRTESRRAEGAEGGASGSGASSSGLRPPETSSKLSL